MEDSQRITLEIRIFLSTIISSALLGHGIQVAVAVDLF